MSSNPVKDLPMSPGQPAAPDPQAAPAGESNPIREAIAEAIAEHKVILFMKGTPEAPACGFSARTVAALQSLDTPFAAVDILPDPRIRQELSAISNWPTIPQLFVHGELVGGCDIVTEMYESGELAETLGVSAPDAPEAAPVGAEPGAPPLQIRNDLAS
jgi:monothiol glutaredoxin